MEVTEKVIKNFEQYEKDGGIASDRRLRSDQLFPRIHRRSGR